MKNNLEELNELVKSVNRGGYFRCGICNSVSNERIETNIGDYKANLPFVNDPKDPRQFVCLDCDEEISSILQDFGVMDSLERQGGS